MSSTVYQLYIRSHPTCLQIRSTVDHLSTQRILQT
uniref:Uncharacterized protein n=1 Tax=Arundo donax TaxID=35708 RepID=A0A0A8XW00_ARUDO